MTDSVTELMALRLLRALQMPPPKDQADQDRMVCAVQTALAAAGLVVVPSIITDAMYDAWGSAVVSGSDDEDIDRKLCQAEWTRMIEATLPPPPAAAKE